MWKEPSPSPLEPGLLQVFRIYAWLRLTSVFFLFLQGTRYIWVRPASGPFPPEAASPRTLLSIPNLFSTPMTFAAPILFSAASTLLLLGLLYWPWFRLKTGHWFLPITLVLASSALIVEQEVFSKSSLFWQGNPLMSILVILVAWQYTYRAVIGFTLATAALDLALIGLLPTPELVQLPFPGLERMVLYGLLISRSVTFLILGYVVTRLAKAQRQQRQALAEANQKLVQHAAVLEQLTINRERLRLSRELHDTLAHTLSAMTVQIEAVLTLADGLPQKVVGILNGMLNTARSGLDDTRRALSALRAAPLEEWGLAVALRMYATDFAARHSLGLELEIPENLDDLPPEVEQTYYRVAQEALENAARHAQAGRLTVQMEQKNGDLSLRIADDGLGFDPQQMVEDRQFGLVGMRERADLIGARLEIDSHPGRGTVVTLKIGSSS